MRHYRSSINHQNRHCIRIGEVVVVGESCRVGVEERDRLRSVHLVRNEQMGTDYVKLNPSEEVPTLVLMEMCWINRFRLLSIWRKARASDALLPKDLSAQSKGQSDMWYHLLWYSTVQNLRVLRKIMGWYDDADERTRRRWNGGRYWIDLGFKGLEKASNPVRVDIVLVISLRWLIFVLFLKFTMRIVSRSICHNFQLFHVLTKRFRWTTRLSVRTHAQPDAM